MLVTKGVVKADKALSAHNEFNYELAGAIICAVEEKDLSAAPERIAGIKEWVTAHELSIRQMRTNTYQVPNTTHWIQTANAQSHCPVFAGDTRITVIEVCDLLPEQEVPKQIMLAKLKEEAPHFMYTLMNLQLPPLIGRMRLPVVRTQSKARTEEINKNPLQQFLDDYCTAKEGLAAPLRRVLRRFREDGGRRREAQVVTEQSRPDAAQSPPNLQNPRPEMGPQHRLQVPFGD